MVLALGAAIVCVTAIQFSGTPGLEDAMLRAGALMGGPGFDQIRQPLGSFAPLVLHVFLHGGWLHLGINMAALVAFGPPTAAVLGRGPRGAALFLVFFFLCAIGGGLAQLLAYDLPGEGGIAVGASSALSGLLPAVGWIRGRWRGALRLAAPWAAINLVLAVTGMVLPLPIAWAAHLGGLLAGLALFPVFFVLGGPRRGPRA